MTSPTSILHRTVRTDTAAHLLRDVTDLVGDRAVGRAEEAALSARIARLAREDTQAALVELHGFEAFLPEGPVRSRGVRALHDRIDAPPAWVGQLREVSLVEVHRLNEYSGDHLAFVLKAQVAGEEITLVLVVDEHHGRTLRSAIVDSSVADVLDGAGTFLPELASGVSCRETAELSEVSRYLHGVGWLRSTLPREASVADPAAIVDDEFRWFRRSSYGGSLDDDEIAHDFVRGIIATDVRATGRPAHACSPRRVRLLLQGRWRAWVHSGSRFNREVRSLRAYISWLYSSNDAPASLVLETFAVLDAGVWRIQRRRAELDYYDGAHELMHERDRDPLYFLGPEHGGWFCLDDGDPLEWLRREVGGSRELDELNAEPLPAEDCDIAAVAKDISDRVLGWARRIDGFLDSWPELPWCEELRTSCRRLLADLAVIDPGTFRRRSSDDRGAAGIVLAVCVMNGVNGVDERLRAHFDLASSGSDRVTSFLGKLGMQRGNASTGPRYHARYLVSSRRESLLGELGGGKVRTCGLSSPF